MVRHTLKKTSYIFSKKPLPIFRETELSNTEDRNFRKKLPSSKNKKTHSEKMFYISGNETLKPKLKKRVIWQEEL